MARIAINGLGRIGRATLKILEDHPELELVAFNDLVPVENLAYLLRYDTVYGRYHKPVTAEGDSLRIGERSIRGFSERDPTQLPWKDLDIDLVFECTGVFRKKADLEKHLQAGAGHAILSAAGKGGDIPSVVFGVNRVEGDSKLVSTASCTTNCVAPVAEIMDRRVGVHKALMSTVHAYTASQGTVDAPASRMERGRTAAANIIPTATGAASATSLVLPQLEDRFDGLAMRVPVPVGSISDITFLTQRGVTVDELKDIFREEAGSDRYRDILGVAEDPVVSSDIIQDARASVVDLNGIQVVGGDLVKILSWYDNEWGYASQMVRQARAMLK